jgi:cellulose biosynthesis protein BcsQ
MNHSYRPAFVVAAIQQKGGVGKTTLAASLYAHAVYAGYESCIVDLDGQGNLSTWAVGHDAYQAIPAGVGVEAITMPHGDVARRYSSFMGAEDRHVQAAEDVRQHMRPCTRLGRGSVLPANVYMDMARVESVRLDLVPAKVVILDTPPRLPATLMRQVLQYTDVVLAPVQLEANAMQAVPDLVSELQHNGAADLLEADALRLVVNMRQRCANHDVWEMVLRRDYGRWVSDVVIPRATAWAEMFNPKAEWKPKSTAGKTAAALWADVERTMERRLAA